MWGKQQVLDEYPTIDGLKLEDKNGPRRPGGMQGRTFKRILRAVEKNVDEDVPSAYLTIRNIKCSGGCERGHRGTPVGWLRWFHEKALLFRF